MKINVGIYCFLASIFILLSSNQATVREVNSYFDYYSDRKEVNTEDPLFLLGRVLFYSPELSKHRNTSCATCHLQVTGFAHVDHNLSHGTNGVFGIRNAPGLWNLENRKHFMLDGRLKDLRTLSSHPITDPLEMDMTFEEIISRLDYLYLMDNKFINAFGDKKVTKDRILDALFAYVKELKSIDSKFDKVIRRKQGYQFNKDEEQGYLLFKKQCSSCHAGVNFSSQKFEFNGLEFDPVLYDLGRMRITGNKKDSFKFLVPSLRNISVTFPYMHDGRFQDLDEVLLHYQGLKEKATTGALSKIQFSDKERNQLKQFLHTLTDTSFLINPRLGFPPNEF